MSKVAIVTDSSCMTQQEADQMGVFLLPMPFSIDGVDYLEGVDLSAEFFYEKLGSDAAIFTSQPAAGAVMDLWDQVLEEHDELVHIPISSGLSGSYGNACVYAQDYDAVGTAVFLQIPFARIQSEEGNIIITLQRFCIDIIDDDFLFI
ncbi:MAG: DegV family protein, partial [Eubacteriales bacterium]|nr:DegV family protein [Eubacteriales bacterium]